MCSLCLAPRQHHLLHTLRLNSAVRPGVLILNTASKTRTAIFNLLHSFAVADGMRHVCVLAPGNNRNSLCNVISAYFTLTQAPDSGERKYESSPTDRRLKIRSRKRTSSIPLMLNTDVNQRFQRQCLTSEADYTPGFSGDVWPTTVSWGGGDGTDWAKCGTTGRSQSKNNAKDAFRQTPDKSKPT